jgi:hypothetical protein
VTIQGPHGGFSIGGGPFVPQVGAYVPDPYVNEIYEGDDGYGFYYNDAWIPTVRYGARWIIVQRPVVYGGYGYARPYAYGYGYARPYAYARPYGYGSVRPYSGYGRSQGFAGRSQIQGQSRSQIQGQGRSQIQGQGRSQIQGQSRSQVQGRQNRGARNDGQTNQDGRRVWNGQQ